MSAVLDSEFSLQQLTSRLEMPRSYSGYVYVGTQYSNSEARNKEVCFRAGDLSSICRCLFSS